MGFQKEKQLILDYFRDLDAATPANTASVLSKYVTEDYGWEGVYPFMDQTGASSVAEVFWSPFKESIHHIQRRQDVFIAGVGTDQKTWVMSMGYLMGLFEKDFLGIRKTNKMQHLQYAEYSCVENGKIVHTALFIDLLGFMLEAGAYPLPQMTGNYFVYPGPIDHNGLLFEDAPEEKSKKTFDIVYNMIDEFQHEFEKEMTPEQFQEHLKKFWADDMIWYGPCGIGASYTIPGYFKQHHAPFAHHMSKIHTNEIYSYFAEGDFACFYTSLETISTGGFLGMPGSGGKQIHMRGDIDIYYCKNGKIQENWCYIDLPYWLHEQGVEIFDRTASIINPN